MKYIAHIASIRLSLAIKLPTKAYLYYTLAKKKNEDITGVLPINKE